MDAFGCVALGVGSLVFGWTGGWAAARRRVSSAVAVNEVVIAAPANEAPAAVAPVEPPAPVVDTGRCAVPDCARDAKLRGLCRGHYGKAYRLGFLDALTPDQLLRLAEDKRRQPRARPVLRLVDGPR